MVWIMKKSTVDLEKKARWVRNQVLEMCVAAGAGHVAPAFSCTDILVALYHGGILRVNPGNLAQEDRDRFILSKGHACTPLYAVLADMGYFPVAHLKHYCQPGACLGGHSDADIPGVEVSTGSLGHGLSIGAGLALAAKMDDKDYMTVVLMSDGECQEGSSWEAAMFAAHHRLDNLVAIVDRNGLQAIDFTEQALALEPLRQKWEAFGWEARTTDGHSYDSLLSTLGDIRSRNSGKPLVVIALTIKGKGVSFMENSIIWQFRIPVGDELAQARKELAK